jgi:hypothetical protein
MTLGKLSQLAVEVAVRKHNETVGREARRAALNAFVEGRPQAAAAIVAFWLAQGNGNRVQ